MGCGGGAGTPDDCVEPEEEDGLALIRTAPVQS